jgi:GR25 family glycosyltransferase involved in LPS biosynthesis
MENNIQYYLIHGVDKSRGPRMIDEFNKWGLDNNKVKWILEPNKDSITYEFRKDCVMQQSSTSCGIHTLPNCPHMGNGKISCTYKHYLCLKDIVENNYAYGVIMEDNQFFCGNIPYHVNLYINQLNKLYPDWDVIFDSKWCSYKNISENNVTDDVYVYPKSNNISKYCHGSTRLAQFYILTNECAKKLYENYIPFNHAPDWWMNDLFRKLNIKCFWAEPSISNVFPHISTAD